MNVPEDCRPFTRLDLLQMTAAPDCLPVEQVEAYRALSEETARLSPEELAQASDDVRSLRKVLDAGSSLQRFLQKLSQLELRRGCHAVQKLWRGWSDPQPLWGQLYPEARAQKVRWQKARLSHREPMTPEGAYAFCRELMGDISCQRLDMLGQGSEVFAAFRLAARRSERRAG
jgi:hypothetical protein